MQSVGRCTVSAGELLPNSIPCKGPAKAPTDRDAGSEDLSKARRRSIKWSIVERRGLP